MNGYKQALETHETLQKSKDFQEFVENMRGEKFSPEELTFIWFLRNMAYQEGYQETKDEMKKKINKAMEA